MVAVKSQIICQDGAITGADLRLDDKIILTPCGLEGIRKVTKRAICLIFLYLKPLQVNMLNQDS